MIGVERVSVYPGDRPMFGATLTEALTFVEQRVAEGKPEPLVLGAMRPGYLGREMVTLADLRAACDTPASFVPFGRGVTLEQRAAMREWTCKAHGVTTAGDCPKCDDELIAMAEHSQTAGVARWSDASEAYLVAVTCLCGNRAVGIDDTPESAESEGRKRLAGYCA